MFLMDMEFISLSSGSVAIEDSVINAKYSGVHMCLQLDCEG